MKCTNIFTYKIIICNNNVTNTNRPRCITFLYKGNTLWIRIGRYFAYLLINLESKSVE